MHIKNLPPQLRKTKKSRLLHFLRLLPEEIIEEILSRLPVKSLLRFRCVSKSRLSLIDSDRFIKIHSQNSTKYTNYRVINNDERDVTSGCSLQSILKEGSSSPSSSIIDPINTGFIVGCCNGVLCFSGYFSYRRGCYSLWNPATGVANKLPKIHRILPKCGFGWDESTAAFKVFATVAKSNKRSGHVYSSKTNSWKTVSPGSNYIYNAVGVFVVGRIHWVLGLHRRQLVIESFDLKSDVFKMIELPPLNARRPRTSLGEIQGCLCTLFDYNESKSIDVWVMKEYGVKESWFKLLTFPLENVCLRGLRIIYAFPPLFGEALNGEIFIISGNTLMVYTPKDDVFSKVSNFNIKFGAHVYVESLVSPLRTLDGTKERKRS